MKALFLKPHGDTQKGEVRHITPRAAEILLRDGVIEIKESKVEIETKEEKVEIETKENKPPVRVKKNIKAPK